MSRVLTANEVCARSLRMIGAFPVTESAPDPEHLREAMHWLDLILAETVGTNRMFKRLNATIGFDLTNGTQSYDLYTSLGDDLPDDGIEFITEAFLEDADTNRSPLEIVTREKFEDVSKPDEEGRPCRVFIDRSDEEAPTLKIFPTPSATDTTAYTLKLVCQRYAPNVSPDGVTGDTPQSATAHEFPKAWQRWLIWQLAHDLGNGPVNFLPEQRLSRFAATANNARERLNAFNNRQHESTPPICEAWGML